MNRRSTENAMANRTKNDLQNTVQKIRFEQHEPRKIRG